MSFTIMLYEERYNIMRTFDLFHFHGLPSILHNKMLSKRRDLLHTIKRRLCLELFDRLGSLPQCFKCALCSGEAACQN